MTKELKDPDRYLEELAALEHEQWIAWSKSLVRTEVLSKERVKRWQNLWVPYDELTEAQKEQDRMWARKAIAITTRLFALFGH